MTGSARRRLIPHAFQDLSQWRVADEIALGEGDSETYRRRKLAVQMYAQGAPYAEIFEATKLLKQRVLAFVKRCLTFDDQGAIAGFSALVPRRRLAGYVRSAPITRVLGDGPGGCAGALTQLFSRFPEVERHVTDCYLGRSGRNIPDIRITYHALHGEFLQCLRKLGLSNQEWPFNTKNCGYKALRAYCMNLLNEQSNRWFGARCGEEAVRRGRIGTGHRSVLPTLRGYGACQLDFHKVDAASVIVIKLSEGGELCVPVARWHIGFLIEERWNLVLGAFAALELTPSADSVLEVVEAALQPADCSKEGASCSFVAGGKVFPNQIMPEIAYQGFSVLKMDNAWSNAANDVVDNIIRTVGCAVNFGPPRAWARRHPIESIFGKLTKRGLQRLPSTFGSGPNDTRRSSPNEQAVKFKIAISDLIDIIHSCIREHNESGNEKLDFTSPISALQSSLTNSSSGVFLQPLPKPAQLDLKLLTHIEIVTVRGSKKKNVRPYISLWRWKYTNALLARSYDLIGQELIVYCDRRDVQNVHAAVLNSGDNLGALLPPPGRREQHMSWRNRVLINQAGLTERMHSNTDSAMKQWREAKQRELSEKKRNAKKGQRPSKEALLYAKVEADRKRQSGWPQLPVDGQRAEALPASPSDSFLIFELPTIKSVILGG